jgi:drug/metabolite transporter (DMT)-like permease
MFVTHFFGFTEPSPAGAALGRLAAAVSVFCYALSVVMIRRMRTVETNMTFAFYGYVAGLLIAGTLCLLRGGPAFSATDIAHLALSGTLAGIASICLMTAYHRAPVALVAPFQYTQIVWGALAGWLFWAHVPDLYLVLGSAIVIVCGLYVIYREIKANEIA